VAGQVRRDGHLAPTDQGSVASRECAGPRNAAWHPSRDSVYVVNELDSTVVHYAFSRPTGELRALQCLSCLSESTFSLSRASGICINKGGSTLYTSNRGEDSIAAFSLDASTGPMRMRVKIQFSFTQPLLPIKSSPRKLKSVSPRQAISSNRHWARLLKD